MKIVKQNRFKNLDELHKEWTEAGVKASRATTHRRVLNLATVVVRGILPGLRRRRTGLLPSGPKSSFQMRASFVFNLETKVLESVGRVKKLIACFVKFFLTRNVFIKTWNRCIFLHPHQTRLFRRTWQLFLSDKSE